MPVLMNISKIPFSIVPKFHILQRDKEVSLSKKLFKLFKYAANLGSISAS